MHLPALLSAAVSLGLPYGPAPKAEFDTFTRGGDVWTTLNPAKRGRPSVIHVGTVGDEVAFVSIAVDTAGKGLVGPIVVGGTFETPNGGGTPLRTRTTAHLILPDGGQLPLPRRAQLLEVADGKVRASARSVTRDEVDAYIRSEPDEYSLDGLLRFADSRRKAAGKKAQGPDR